MRYSSYSYIIKKFSDTHIIWNYIEKISIPFSSEFLLKHFFICKYYFRDVYLLLFRNFLIFLSYWKSCQNLWNSQIFENMRKIPEIIQIVESYLENTRIIHARYRIYFRNSVLFECCLRDTYRILIFLRIFVKILISLKYLSKILYCHR